MVGKMGGFGLFGVVFKGRLTILYQLPLNIPIKKAKTNSF
ncbi:hypothetical protein BCLUESOX_1505 [bacterium endosymbiont of Bathymodiolus sp. 5 South]|jgi:hypothetical protein|nr:hypothetical protein [uncultured Gammaproteobacteria bacterium]SHN91213.1 hypothetical protein BCLUESOX_1505 [bacterium endosymbiont of Bathymodiolus sp. 5 South]VVH58802.1 hypothetical protein BSPCLSOX_2061 [uncultured Gammaproteobacteria bacterium]VVH62983.1 hypothetical protein BSPWISOX_1891 [uncultured Gammaproteobacteria bacterium]